MIEYATEWRSAGACLAADPDLFFPIAAGAAAGPQTSRALRICGGCAVKRQCLDFALQTNETTGIWGGTTPDERVFVLRARRKLRPAHQGTRRSAAEALAF